MKKLTGIAAQVIGAALCVAAGLLLGSGLRSASALLAPAYTTGDFGELHRDTGAAVVLFSTSTCPHCQRARELLDGAHVAYRNFVLDESVDARRRFAALKGDAVPLVIVGDRRIVGFRENALRDALARIEAATTQSP